MNGRDGIYLTPCTSNSQQFLKKEFVTLPETNSSPLKMDAWNTFSFPFWGKRPIFRGKLAVTGWWLNHPSEKYARQIGNLPQGSG